MYVTIFKQVSQFFEQVGQFFEQVSHFVLFLFLWFIYT
jgi:hypothetical protein